MKVTHRSLIALQAGRWFKLIGGASYQHLPAIRNLALAYTLAGADCIDVAADPAVVEAVKASFRVVSQLRQIDSFGFLADTTSTPDLPLLMVSFSDGEDPHFRKAKFDPVYCPADCPRPCEAICPADAIAFDDFHIGVIEARCYGCGRCLPICPIQHIETVTRATAIETIAADLLEQVDGIEIHTQVGHSEQFAALWSALKPALHRLSVVSISCPDHPHSVDYLWRLFAIMQPLDLPLIWQTDGRPMSGDIGKGTTRATLRYAQKVLQTGPPGYVQLAGGTNHHTVTKLPTLLTEDDRAPYPMALSAQLAEPTAPLPTLGGVAFGSFARRLLSAWSEQEDLWQPLFASAVHHPERLAADELNHLQRSLTHLSQAVQAARSLVAPLKGEALQVTAAVEPTERDRSPVLAAFPQQPQYSSSFE